MAGMWMARRGFTRASWWRVPAASQGWNPSRAIVKRHLETQREVTMGPGMEKMGKQLLLGMATHARAIPVKGESIEVLETPSQFYDVLLQGVRNARSRVMIASLYIGTGTLEQELVGSLYYHSLCLMQALHVPGHCIRVCMALLGANSQLHVQIESWMGWIENCLVR